MKQGMRSIDGQGCRRSLGQGAALLRDAAMAQTGDLLCIAKRCGISHLCACVLVVAGLVLVGLSGCGGSQGRASVTPGPMPTTGSFSGVWYSAQYGEMEMDQVGKDVVANYAKNERSGLIQGIANGNLLRFQWEEKRELVPGRPTVSKGRGYFQYIIGEDGKHYLRGEWGNGYDERGGGEWRAYKLRELARDGAEVEAVVPESDPLVDKVIEEGPID